MKTTISRRAFHAGALSLGAACVFSSATFGATTPAYRVRWRYFTQVDFARFWIRVLSIQSPSTDVPLVQQFALDTQFTQLVGNNMYVASSAQSHIVRGYFQISSGIHSQRLPLYTRLLVNGTTRVGHIIQIKHS